MQTKIILKVAVIVFISVLSNQGYAQTRNDSITGEPQDCVINMKMIEKFRASYDKVEVISWQEVLLENSFVEAKDYLNAYLNIDLDKVEGKNLERAINTQMNNARKSFKEGLDKQYPLASRSAEKVFKNNNSLESNSSQID